VKRLTETEKADAALAAALSRAMCELPFMDEPEAFALMGIIECISEARSHLAKRIARTEVARRAAGCIPLKRLPGETELW
jgi:hypothetical protein